MIQTLRDRQQWGEQIQAMIIKLGVLTNGMGNVRQAGWWFRKGGSYKSSDVVSSGEMHPGLYQRAREPGFADDIVQCFINDEGIYPNFDLMDNLGRDPHVPICHTTGSHHTNECGTHAYHKYRYEYELDLEAKEGLSALENFWSEEGLVKFLAGDYPVDDSPMGFPGVREMWLMRSSKVDNLAVNAVRSDGTWLPPEFRELASAHP